VKTFGRLLFVVAIVAVSALGMLLMFPGMKEGTSWEELPFYLGGALGFPVVGLVWWYASGRSLAKAVPVWIVVALPTLASAATAFSLVSGYISGYRLAGAIQIEGYTETPIHWPGFDGPVGVTTRFEVVHPKGLGAHMLPPEVRMGPAIDIPRTDLSFTHTSGSGYFKDSYLETPVGALTLLKTVLFQRLYVNDQAEQEYQNWTSALRFDDDGRTAITYHLHPGIVDYLVDPGRICLSNLSPGIPRCEKGQDPTQRGCLSRNRVAPPVPLYNDGRDLTALWMAAGSGVMAADLGPVLTETLRAKSILQGDPATWAAIQKRLEPSGLRGAGYRLCPPGDDSHTAFRTCFCQDSELSD
jgi:hypothetical protein